MMATTVANSTNLSETWLLERTYHAQLLDGRELSVTHLTEAMQQLTDIADVPSMQSARSLLPAKQPLQRGSIFSVPISSWQEITQEEARATYQQGEPVLLYSEHTWKHTQETTSIWRPNQNMRTIIYGTAAVQPEASSGIEYAVCYLDARHGAFSNVAWKKWFTAGQAILFEEHDQPVTFLRPVIQFPYTTHYTVVAADGLISEYPGHAEALQGFVADPLKEEQHGTSIEATAPHFSYYHEVTCPSGIYRLDFFGPRMDEPGYKFTEQPLALL